MNQTVKANTWIIALFLMQFGILLPISLVINIEYVYIIFTLSLLIYSLIINEFHFNKLFLIFSLTVFIFILVSMIVNGIPYHIMRYMSWGFIIKSFVAIYIGSNLFDFKYLYRVLTKIAWINLIFLLFSITLLNLNEYVNYMRLGYGLVPSIIIILANLFTTNNKVKNILGLLTGVTLLLLYGSRGAFLVIVIFIILFMIYFSTKSIKGLFVTILSSLILTVVYYYGLFSKFILYLYKDLGIYSYNLMKFTRTIEAGLSSSSSGRDILYYEGIQHFLRNPIFGNGVGYTFTYTNTSAHNLFLQVLIESGLFGFITIIIVMIIILMKINFISNEYIKIVFIIMFSISIGRLLISSDLWLRPELWLFIGMIIMYLNNKHQYLGERSHEVINNRSTL